MFTDAFKQFQKGIELQKSGFLEEAAYKYSSLLDKTESYEATRWKPVENKYKAYANFNLASIRFQQCRYDEAIHHYSEGLNFEPKNYSAHIDLAKSYEMTGQWDDAIYHINESLKVYPNHTTALRRKKRILEEKQFYESLQSRLEFEMNYKSASDSWLNSHLTIQADYEIEEHVCELVESLMRRVYLELNSEFNFQPKDSVKIILFYDKTYNFCSMSFPRWAAGMYEDGSIKILLRTTDRIHLGLVYVLLRHEYVHKIVEQLSNGKCPRWFNEGLSEYKARRTFDFERNLLKKAIAENKQIPLYELEYKLMMPKYKMRLAYIQARSIVELIVEELGMMGVCRLLQEIGSSKIFSSVAADNEESYASIYQFLETTPEQLQAQFVSSVI